MKIPREAATAARRTFRSCLDGDLLDEEKLRDSVRSMLDKKPRHWRPIVHELMRLARLQLEKHKVRVESGIALHEREKQRLRDELAAKYGDGLHYEFAVNPALLGGMRVRVGDDVWDGSVKGRLDRLAASF